ncbi:MAG: hypothetical protein M1835_005702 [Candelina submexicana]|nr:MAG: hypothetical protein M1835_005702 [Candelina submexicana]
MTGALTLYSATFMRYALAVSPRNYLLFGCHFINEGSQLTQGYRYLQYWHFGGREKSLAEQARAGVSEARTEAEGILQAGTEKGQETLSKGKGFVKETKERMS